MAAQMKGNSMTRQARLGTARAPTRGGGAEPVGAVLDVIASAAPAGGRRRGAPAGGAGWTVSCCPVFLDQARMDGASKIKINAMVSTLMALPRPRLGSSAKATR